MLVRIRRHPFLTALALGLVAATVAAALFLASFDLNNYRATLEGTLRSELHRPVSLGEIRFTWQGGPGLDVRNFSLGAGDDPFTLQVEHLILRLRLAPLLHRRLTFSRVFLDQPQITFRPMPEVLPAPRREGRTPIEFLRRLEIETLTLRDARLRVVDRRFATERTWGTEQVDAQIRHLSLTRAMEVTAAGRLPGAQGGATWKLNGMVEPPASGRPWQEGAVKLDLSLQQLTPAHLAFLTPGGTPPLHLEGSCDLLLRTNGSPAQGLVFDLRASGNQLAISSGKLYSKPLLLRKAHLAGVWQSGETDRIRQLDLTLDGLHARGEISLPRQAEQTGEALLTLDETPLVNLAPLVPDRLLPRLAADLNQPQTAGTLRLEGIRLTWPQDGLRLDQARLLVRDGRLHDPRLGLIEDAQLDLLWQERTLSCTTARTRLLGGDMALSGSVAFPRDDEPQLHLQLTGRLAAEGVLPLLPEPWQSRLQMSGPITLTATVEGKRSRLLLDGGLQFRGAALAVNGRPWKIRDAPGELLLLGAVANRELELSHARLILPFAEVRANGSLGLEESGRYVLSCDVSHLLLDKLPPLLDVQTALAPRGEVELRLDLSGDRSGLATLTGSGAVHKLGLHLWGAVADLRGGTGYFKLDRRGLDLSDFSALVGLSPLQARARLDWLPDFALGLDVELPKVRAADLIFNSPKLSLEEVRGHLAIDRRGIRFQQIAARIGTATAVTVDGVLQDYDRPLVKLAIDASRARVGDVIALWSDGGKRAAPPPSATPVTVEIAARIAEGDLYGLDFQQAAGAIAVREHRLLIHPLQLRIGSGSASVQIASSRLDAPAPLLKVSGRVEGIDADEVYNQMLQRPGLLTGKLTGDFYLEGVLGNYLPTCTGGAAIDLRRGALRGFTGLGRVFSLLNLGNLLTLRLPDLDREGFPYEAITATLTLKNGVLRTEDLLIDSTALDMALVGSHDLANDRLDMTLGVKPLSTVDKILSSIPLAGWLLTGEKKALVTAQFRITGKSQDPQVEAIPISSLSEMVVGIFKRTLGLPGKVVRDVTGLFEGDQEDGGEKSPPAPPPPR